jgi:hypothetical protein
MLPPFSMPVFLQFKVLKFERMELVLRGPADRANPFMGKILESSPQNGAAIRVAFDRVINISADFTFPFGHDRILSV